MRRRQLLQLGDHRLVTPDPQLRIGVQLVTLQAQLIQPRGGGPRERLLDPGERRSPPLGQRLGKQARRPLRRRGKQPPPHLQGVLEPRRVHPLRRDIEHVTAVAGDEDSWRTRLEGPADRRHGRVHHR